MSLEEIVRIIVRTSSSCAPIWNEKIIVSTMLSKTFLFCILSTLLSFSSAFVQPHVATVPKKTTSLAWGPTGVDPWMAEMMVQTNPGANLAFGLALVSIYEVTSGRWENFSKSKKDGKKNKVFQWTASGEA
eukprot:scaffold27504_cov148-Amphora_coffeaeformis.AAC.2